MNKNTDNYALAGLILGISSLVGVWIPVICYLAIPAAIVGIVLSVMGLKSTTKKGMAIGGLVCSIVALSLLLLALMCVCVFDATYFGRYF